MYVDDIIPISNNTDLLKEEKLKLSHKFEMTDHGSRSYILGMCL